MIKLPDFDAMYKDIASTAKIERAHVLCRKCGATRLVAGYALLQHGWPKCCGETMMPGAATEKKRDD